MTAFRAASWRARLVVVAAAAILLPAGAALLYTFPPGRTPFYPPCMLHQLTGWHCPGCGGTRCAHALLHGDVLQALAYNPLLVVLSPLLALGAVQLVYSWWTGRRWPWWSWPWWTWHLLLWVMIAFGVLRNIDVYPLTLLAPHAL